MSLDARLKTGLYALIEGAILLSLVQKHNWLHKWNKFRIIDIGKCQKCSFSMLLLWANWDPGQRQKVYNNARWNPIDFSGHLILLCLKAEIPASSEMALKSNRVETSSLFFLYKLSWWGRKYGIWHLDPTKTYFGGRKFIFTSLTGLWWRFHQNNACDVPYLFKKCHKIAVNYHHSGSRSNQVVSGKLTSTVEH